MNKIKRYIKSKILLAVKDEINELRDLDKVLGKQLQYLKNDTTIIEEKLEVYNRNHKKVEEQIELVQTNILRNQEQIELVQTNILRNQEQIELVKIPTLRNEKEIDKQSGRIDKHENEIEKLMNYNYADKNDFIAFYNLLLGRMPSDDDIVLNSVYRKDLFNNIIFSKEYNNLLESSKNRTLKINNIWDKPTYSQTGEDSIIFYILNMLNIDIKNVTYLDLGANHAKDLSNTYFFYERGASGVLVEANPTLVDELIRERPRDKVLNRCVSETDEDTLKFYILNGDGLSSPDYESVCEFLRINEDLEIIKTIDVKSITTKEIVDCYLKEAPTILNIDIEGNELSIIKSFDLSVYRPLIIIAEMIPYSKKLVVGDKNEEIVKFLKDKNYTEYAFTGINSIFIDNDKLKGKL